MKSLTLLILAFSLLTFVGCGDARKIEMTVGTYDKDCSLPRKGWLTSKDGIGHLRVVFPVKVDRAGKVIWNDKALSDQKLREYVHMWSGFSPQPQVVLEVNSKAPCHRVEVVRDIMDAAPICRGEYSYCSEGRDWSEWKEVGGP